MDLFRQTKAPELEHQILDFHAEHEFMAGGQQGETQMEFTTGQDQGMANLRWCQSKRGPRHLGRWGIGAAKSRTRDGIQIWADIWHQEHGFVAGGQRGETQAELTAGWDQGMGRSALVLVQTRIS